MLTKDDLASTSLFTIEPYEPDSEPRSTTPDFALPAVTKSIVPKIFVDALVPVVSRLTVIAVELTRSAGADIS